jgi:hypothetical protein
MANANLEDALNSMLRTDYIALSDTPKLQMLSKYYVDYGGYVSQVVGPTDQLIVGRRGTGKTTLLYRSLVECMNSWGKDSVDRSSAKPRTLGIYLDLEKCQSLTSDPDQDFALFEHSFTLELSAAIKQELTRSWPALENKGGLIERVFNRKEVRRAANANNELDELSRLLRTGLPRFVDLSGQVQHTEKAQTSTNRKAGIDARLDDKGPGIKASLGEESGGAHEVSITSTESTVYKLNVSDLLRVLGRLREAAEIPHIVLFIDEFSSLNERLQGRFTTLLKKILGNHSGIYVKLCAITDHYNLGSAIILQRDLFELSLDLDAFVERSGSLSVAMTHLEQLTRNIISSRLEAYGAVPIERLFRDSESAMTALTNAAMGVPRTLGIVLKQAWGRASSAGGDVQRIRVADLDYGVRYASRAYLNQMLGAAKRSVAIPEHVIDLWDALLSEASNQTHKSRSNRNDSSHFMLLPRYEERLKFLNMFFLVHLLEQGRATKKESANRSLYCFDYGTAVENRLGWNTNRDIIRQQRFAYDSILEGFDRYYESKESEQYQCPECGVVYESDDLVVAGGRLEFCPKDRADLALIKSGDSTPTYTEEEIKILGAIRSARVSDQLIARQVADDVGCYIQKVAKFGAKMDKNGLIARTKPDGMDRNVYFAPEDNKAT